MGDMLRTIDRLLRGGFTTRDDLIRGRLEVSAGTLVWAAVLLGAVYGAFMGLYGLLRPADPSIAQMAATIGKVPLLFLLTLGVTLPSLYVCSALAGSRLQLLETSKFLLVSIVVHLALLASFGPVTGFFTLSTESYHFMVVLNVFFFGVSGLVGLGFLRRTMRVVFEREAESMLESAPPRPAASEGGEGSAPATRAGRSYPSVGRTQEPRASRVVFLAWTVIYGVVGAQMGWILRPFVGSPGQAFEFFRERDSNFFEAFFKTLGKLLSF